MRVISQRSSSTALICVDHLVAPTVFALSPRVERDRDVRAIAVVPSFVNSNTIGVIDPVVQRERVVGLVEVLAP